MEHAKIMEYAQALYSAHGDKAEAEAAQRAKHHGEAGETEQAEDWRAIRAAIRGMRGPNES